MVKDNFLLARTLTAVLTSFPPYLLLSPYAVRCATLPPYAERCVALPPYAERCVTLPPYAKKRVALPP
eukprot:scaffold153387_cov24-Tisochrysis_lutea.AAC.2